MTLHPAPLDFDAVLFDMDGLLLDSEPLWAEVTDAVCALRGGSYDHGDIEACLGRGIDLVAAHLIAKKGFRDTQAELERAIFDGMVAAFPTCREHDAAGDLLRAVKARGPLALGTSTNRALVEAALTRRGYLELFDTVVTGSDVERRKPSPDIYLEAAKRLGVPIARCVVLEDSLPGCQAGRAAGATVIAVGASNWTPLLPFSDHRVASLREAAALLAITLP